MTFGPGVIGGRGDVDIQRDVFHPVKTTWQQTIRLALALTIGYVCLIVILSLGILSWAGFAWWWWLVRYLAEWLLIPVVVIFGVSFIRAGVLYYAVVVKNPRWPGPLAQADPRETGYTSAYRYPIREAETPEVQTITIEGSVKSDDGKQSRHWRLNTEHPEEWQRYAKALSRVSFRPPFSVRSARYYGIPQEEFTHLAHGWARSRFATRTSSAKNAHFKLTKWGRAYMRELANTPLP